MRLPNRVGMSVFTPILLTCLVMIDNYAATINTTDLQRSKRTIIGYYPLCPQGCASCSYINGCVTCKRRKLLLLQRDGMRQTGVCVAHCPQGYYGVRIQNFRKCQRCAVAHCESCSSRSHCTACRDPYIAHEGTCVLGCPAPTYYSYFKQQCVHEVQCMVGEWSQWSPCLRGGFECGFKYGRQRRSREVLQEPSPDGSSCPSLSETRRCRMEHRNCLDMMLNDSELSYSEVSSWRKIYRRLKQRLRTNRRTRKRNKISLQKTTERRPKKIEKTKDSREQLVESKAEYASV